MKVGILTLPLHTNYGGNLQAYALINVLKKNNIDVVFLDRQRNKYNPLRYLISLPKGVVKKYILRKPAPIFDFLKAKLEYDQVSIHAREFTDHYIKPKSAALYNGDDLLRECQNLRLDAIIVGSDQVWKPSYTPDIYNYFFDFADPDKINLKRISYAASFGNDDWKYTDLETQRCASLLKKFSAISVREDLAVTQCKEHFAVDATHVLDPTLLLAAEDYLSLLTDKGLEKTSTVTSYVLDNSDFINTVFAKVSKSFACKISRLNTRTEELNAPIEERIAPPVQDWLHGIYTAKLLITDSFHGCAFAILFNVPFIVIGNERRGISRFNSLLNLFALQARMVKSESDITRALNHTIDWHDVNARLSVSKEESLGFLLTALDQKTELTPSSQK
ncbi:polysaccharide pyruvyl transferase family protein [Paraglaciecola sp.]|uniref:polysaccharide pyruvyl transferase family protein n=1 Tax=Paraglaciecola sp. TaxID=1920173 RepID=UPI00273DB5B1|nr:polysaccharide pyruvyl transferase family protein [Paraglaciecola sp.]MDP5030966.1 polysaccharide pyruvyl transferase family protein [Paraglaciecola sp.]